MITRSKQTFHITTTTNCNSKMKLCKEKEKWKVKGRKEVHEATQNANV